MPEMNEILSRFLVVMLGLVSYGSLAADLAPRLTAGKTFTVQFPEMPPTFYALEQKEDVRAQMTVYLPTNYDAARKYPLFIFLNGGNGGAGVNLGVARSLTEGKDFVCVSVPLFKTSESRGFVILSAPDGQYMWPFFEAMLEKLEEMVPNIDSAHRILGGFSNGAHATAALLDGSEGEVARRFSAFLFVEGGGKLEHYDQLKGKPFLMVSSNPKSRPRAQEICDTAKAAGAQATLIFYDAGRHDFPIGAYPAVRQWLRGPACCGSGAAGQADGPGRSRSQWSATPE